MSLLLTFQDSFIRLLRKTLFNYIRGFRHDKKYSSINIMENHVSNFYNYSVLVCKDMGVSFCVNVFYPNLSFDLIFLMTNIKDILFFFNKN